MKNIDNQETDNQTPQITKKNKFKLSINREKLNFIIALSAFLVSAASFYATYLQAKSAEQQVKAMTYPLIQFAHSNYDSETKEDILRLKLKNSGVGPSIIKSVEYLSDGESYKSFSEYLTACCSVKGLKESIKNSRSEEPLIITDLVNNQVLPINEEIVFFQLKSSETVPLSKIFWQKLNKARFNLTLKVCYCSLIDNCYVTQSAGIVSEVKFCSA
jgi:hypothetical protein